MPEPVSEPNWLWDPWLDNNRDIQDNRPEIEAGATDRDEPSNQVDTVVCFPAEQARVRPRVISPETGAALPLDDKIGQLIQEGRYQLIGLVGGPGSGKTTALRHLAAVLPPWVLTQVRLVDDPEGSSDIVALDNSDCHFVISAGTRLPPAPRQVIFPLAPWGQDDVIEYLLSVHGDQCASVMARLKAPNDLSFIKGVPELWTVVLDRMARDESIVDVRAAIRSELVEWFEEHPQARVVAEDLCLASLGQNSNVILNLSVSALFDSISKQAQLAEKMYRLIRHRPVSLLLAADRIKDIAERGHADSAFAGQLPYDLIQEAALTIAGNTLALQHLGQWLNRGEQGAVHPMAASLLHAAVPGWHLGPDCRPRLSGAYLARAAWSHSNLSRVDLESADLKEADLSSANLEKSRATRARISAHQAPGGVARFLGSHQC